MRNRVKSMDHNLNLRAGLPLYYTNVSLTKENPRARKITMASADTVSVGDIVELGYSNSPLGPPKALRYEVFEVSESRKAAGVWVGIERPNYFALKVQLVN